MIYFYMVSKKNKENEEIEIKEKRDKILYTRFFIFHNLHI